jgi:hypothetical protein
MSGSSSSHCCLVCILFGLCLAFVVILAAVVIYHLNSSGFILTTTTPAGPRIDTITKKRQLPDFVNTNIDPCEHFYDFVCDKKIRRKTIEQYNNEEEYEQKSTQIRHEIHGKLMTNISSQAISSKSMNKNFSEDRY